MNLGLSKKHKFQISRIISKIQVNQAKATILGGEIGLYPTLGMDQNVHRNSHISYSIPIYPQLLQPSFSLWLPIILDFTWKNQLSFFWSNFDPRSPSKMAKIKKGRYFSDKLQPSNYAYMLKPYIKLFAMWGSFLVQMCIGSKLGSKSLIKS